MKIRKMISILCVGAMLLSSSVSAQATPNEAMVRSTFAGATMRCQVILDNADGSNVVSKMVEISIPSGATKGQESDLVQAAALASVNTSASRSARSTDVISTQTGLTIVSGWEWNVGGGKLEKNYTLLMMQFNGITIRNNAKTLILRVTNDKSPTGAFTAERSVYSNADAVVYMRTSDAKVGLQKDDTVIVNATTDQGGIDVSSCVISAST